MPRRLPLVIACVIALAGAACGRLGFDPLVAEPGDARDDGTLGMGGGPQNQGGSDAQPMEGPDAEATNNANNLDAKASIDAPPNQDGGGKLDAGAKLDAAAKPDATMPPVPDCVAVATSWTTSFDGDPTKADANNDAIKDWSAARGAFAASQIKNSQWQPSASVALLDTAPLSDFATRTLLSLNMQHGEFLYPQTNDLGGAIAWMNLDNQTTNGIAVYLRLVRVSPTQQTLYLQANGAKAPLATFTVDGGLQELTLEANPRTSKARLWVARQYKGEWTLPRTGTGPNGDAFATIGTFFGSAVFDDVEIEQCAP